MVAGDPTRPKAQQHVCHVCHKQFTRAEHVQRHVLAHEKRKPFKCRLCGTRYGRADVLGRHLKKCGAGSRVTEANPVQNAQTASSHNNQESMSNNPQRDTDGNSQGDVQLATMRTQADTNDQSIVVAGMPTGSRPDIRETFDVGATDKNHGTNSRLQQEYGNIMMQPISPTSLQSNHARQEDSHIPDDSSTAPNHQLRTPSTLLPSEDSLRVEQTRNIPQGQPFHSYDTLINDPTNGFMSTLGRQMLSPSRNLFQGVGFEPEHVNPHAGFHDSSFQDSMFLEDALLPNFAFNVVDEMANLDSMEPVSRREPAHLNFDHQIRQQPNLNIQVVTAPGYNEASRTDEIASRPALRITSDEVETLEENIMTADVFNMLDDFKLPSSTSVRRALNAYITYFDPHTPIIHWPTFSISGTHAALVLATLAIGARHLSEQRLATAYYDAAVVLLSQHEIEASWCGEESLSLWPVQATLLCAQFGAFSDDRARARRAQYQLSFASTMLRHGLDWVAKLKMTPNHDWNTWIYLQTYSRVASWSTILFANVLSYDPSMSCIVTHQSFELPLPKDRDLWYARSSREWQHYRGDSLSQEEIGLFTATKMLLQGENIPVPLTSFGLLTLIGAILAYICSHDRLSVGLGEVFRSDFTSRLERSLVIWEQMWRSHPRSEQTPSKQGDPLMADCFPLLSSSRYHLHVGKELLVLKSLAIDPQTLFQPLQIRPNAGIYKAITHAANSWLVRAKIGVAHLERTAALEFGGHTLIAAYEGALLLSWWLSLEDERRHPSGDATNLRDKTLENIIDEIFEHLSEQDGGCTDSRRFQAPISFYRRLMASGFWTYGLDMSRSLEKFSERLLQLQGN